MQDTPSPSTDLVSVTIQETATRWLDGDSPPAHSGVYQRQYPGGPYSFWDGHVWHADAGTADEAAAMTALSPRQNCLWRGLTERIGSSKFHPPQASVEGEAEPPYKQ